MKNKIALASAFLAASSFSTAEVVVNDFLSFEGFVDMSYTTTDTEFGNDEANENSFAIDQVEISWLFDFDPVTAQIDLQYEDLPGDTTAVEQAFATYHLDNGGALTAGRYASMLGFEAFEPTGLYQYSVGYDMELLDTSILPGYSQGVKYTLEQDNTFFGISVQDEAYDNGEDRLGGNAGESTYAVEAAGSIAMDNGVTFFLGGVFEEGEDSTEAYTLNAYTTFETGAWIFAAELNYGENERGFGLSNTLNNLTGAQARDLIGDQGLIQPSEAGEEDVLQALVMANFAYSEQASITGRVSYTDHESDASLTFNGTGDIAAGTYDAEIEADFLKYTLAHGYAFTDNLFLVTEVSYVDGEVADVDYEALEGAVELIFSF